MHHIDTTDVSPDYIKTAAQFINSTASHIFLTGKAGTGKTTFLKNLYKSTHKQFAIVAPTGIAALNAGGVTIHSQFLLPFGMFIPDQNFTGDFSGGGNLYSSKMLARKHPLNSSRKQVLRSIDLLVIDEVSMLRADLLDAIDYRLKSARGNSTQRFGGVQLLLIGDLFQLPPVVRRDEEMVLNRYYNTPWFFESKALQHDGFVYIELNKIFRQQDESFIQLLNNLRTNQPTQEDIDLLNTHYKSAEEIQQVGEVITLTTHNYKADEINQRMLNALESPLHTMEASVEGDFPESMYPILYNLQLKEGAQIMFTKNDNEEKMYFNGKLATIESISNGEVNVKLADTNALYTLKKEVWENKRYTINSSSQEIEDEVIGTFEQYPVKLAWAITVHKSQGLTFDKAIIDLEGAFADGQVYVALSRLRSLDGLILRTKINTRVISTDKNIKSFTNEKSRPDELPAIIKEKQKEFLAQLINKTFHFGSLTKEIDYIMRGNSEKSTFEETAMKSVLDQMRDEFQSQKATTEKYRYHLHTIVKENDQAHLLKRINDGSDYYRKFLWKQTEMLLRHIAEMSQRKRVKAYVTSLKDFDLLVSKKLDEVDKLSYLTQAIFEGRDQYDFADLSAQRSSERERLLTEIHDQIGDVSEKKKKGKRSSRKKNKKDEPSTYDITLQLLQSGLSIDGIAKERGLTIGTIDTHMARLVANGTISLDSFIDEANVSLITVAIDEMSDSFTSKDLYEKFQGKFSYGQLRAVMNHVSQLKENSEL